MPESIYLLHAGSKRVGALDVRLNLQSEPAGGVDAIISLQYLIEAADRIEEGLPVPAHLELMFVAGTALGGKCEDGHIEKRLGFVSGLTLLGCHEADSINKSYGELAQSIRKHCHPSVLVADNKDLFRRMVYNIFVTNNDDHLRNHGFVWDPKLLGWRLSPLYDVTPNTSMAHDRYLHLNIGPQGKHAHLDNALASHSLFRLSEKDAAQSIAQIWEKVRAWQVCFEACGVPRDQIDKVASAFRHIDDISSAAVRRKLG